jgi:hypothetical protein
MTTTKICLLAALAVLASTAAGTAFAPMAAADCNYSGGSTLCASGTVSGSSGAPAELPAYSPYPCYGDPTCDYYDIYDPGISWDLPNFGRPGGGPGILPR